MVLKLYYDLISQPARTLYIFLKQCNIPFEKNVVNLGKGANLSPEFLKINPFHKVPVIEHNGFSLIESVAILRYLCREFKVDDHWYPSSSKSQAKVDEFLEWQHSNIRLHCSGYFVEAFLKPLMTGKPAEPERVARFKARMDESLDLLENIWLKDRPFLTGDKITIADLLGACEVEQPRLIGFEPRDGRPRLTDWLKRVETETNPYYGEAHKYVNNIAMKRSEDSARESSKL